jgi:hypothetical protein
VVPRLAAARDPQVLCITMPPQATTAFSELFDLGLWSSWFAQLDRGFIFLLLLPFVVALVGLWAWFRDKDEKE